MLETVDLEAKLGKEAYQSAQEALDLRIGELQRSLQRAGIPMVVVFEGWDAAGKGTAIGRLVRPLDPRGFKVVKTAALTQEETLRPPMWRFWRTLPQRGYIMIYDRSWYQQVLDDRVMDGSTEADWRGAYERIRTFERQLTEDGVVIVKFWLHISKKEQAKRFRDIQKDPAMAWRITKEDMRRHKRYDDFCIAVEDMLRETSTPNAPWHVIPSHDRRYARVEVAEAIAAAAENALAHHAEQKAAAAPPHTGIRRTSPLDRVDLTKTLSREDYERKLPKLQQELLRLEHLLYVKRIPAVAVYEGWDAAGKGGNIRRMTCELDPRGYEVAPVGAPQGDEKTHHYLWRFWRAIPKAGHITIFDRSWYGRVLVERVEGFAQPTEWLRAYREINEFEHELVSYGTVLVKFWIHISKEEQLARFESRQALAHKSWKITEEDWRNREKWEAYWDAVSDMIEQTSTLEAPWTVLEGNCKLHARVKALEVMTEAIQRRLDEHDKGKHTGKS